MILVIIALSLLSLSQSMKLKVLREKPKYSGMTVERNCIDDTPDNIHASTTSFRIPVREIIMNATKITDGKPFIVQLEDIAFDTMERSVLLDAIHLIQEQIARMSLAELMEESGSRYMSPVRRLTISLSPFLRNWRQFDLRSVRMNRLVEIKYDHSIRKTIAISRLLADIPGVDKIWPIDPQWLFHHDAISLSMVEQIHPPEVAIDIVKAILYRMSQREMDEKRVFIRELGMIVFQKLEDFEEADHTLQQITNMVPSLPDGKSTEKRQIVRGCFEGIQTLRLKQPSFTKPM